LKLPGIRIDRPFSFAMDRLISILLSKADRIITYLHCTAIAGGKSVTNRISVGFAETFILVFFKKRANGEIYGMKWTFTEKV
jgi:hypothetical protein